MSELQKRIRDLMRLYGSYRKLAKMLKVDHAYLCKLRKGEKNNPSDALLEKLNLERVVTVTYKDRT